MANRSRSTSVAVSGRSLTVNDLRWLVDQSINSSGHEPVVVTVEDDLSAFRLEVNVSHEVDRS